MTAADSGVRYQPLDPDRPASALEEELLAQWTAEDLFRQSLDRRAGGKPWVFFEGPPTANGRPGIHHVFSRTIKDLFCRHRAMKGHWVLRKAGWDTHGLPVEIEVEKSLGISGKQQIEEVGVEKFNLLCRESVWRYRGDWEKLSARIAYWLDYSDPYVTYSNDYVESVWWALKTLYEKDLLYRGHKILPYCPRCGTALSSHEVAQGYEDVVDPSVYIALDLEGAGSGQQGAGDSAHRAPLTAPASRRRILVWTTTPWTLPSNVALAVHPELEYVELRKKTGAEWTILLAEARAGAVLGEDWRDRWDVVATLHGRDLVGMRYRRPLDWIEYGEGEHEVIVGEEFVSADDGTGVVHMAPAFGADDYAAGQRHKLAFVQPVNARGEFAEGTPVVGGVFVKTADPLIVEELKKRDVLWKAGTMEHAYPHCWRCRTPLLYYARGSWFVRTTGFKDAMLARNARVNWQPAEVGEGRFGEWLKNNIDWAISRDRYWGTTLPVWLCDADDAHLDVVGSYAELAERTGQPLPADFDPHKPYVDRVRWRCTRSGCNGTMHRVPEVIDTWFDSGSMPFAQWHYPFENRDVVATQYPADFIAEGVDQTRGWFYSLLAIATGLGDALPNNLPSALGSRLSAEAAESLATPGGTDRSVAEGREPRAESAYDTAPYRSVVVNDLVLDAQGQKMSKSRGNTVDPWAVVERHGADAIRLFLVASSQVWLPRRFDENAIRETAGRFLVTLKNTYSGIFAQYANFGWTPSDRDPAPGDRPELDRWVLSRLSTVEHQVDEYLERLEATLALRAIMEFVDEDLSKWYVRLSRARFYDVDSDDNRAAFATLHETLVVVARLLAPFAPFVSDWLHRELTGESVHLAPYVRDVEWDGGEGARRRPRAPRDALLEQAMEAVRTLVNLGHAARQEGETRVKVRQPLSRLVCVLPNRTLEAAVTPLLPLLAAELNVKRVDFASSADELVSLEAKPNFRSLGKKFGKATPLAAKAVQALSSAALLAFERGEPIAISVGGETHEIDAEDVQILRKATGTLSVAGAGDYLVAIDKTVTPELRTEGLARELISRVQRMRKEAGFAVSDRIRLGVWGNAEVEDAVRAYEGRIADEVLATGIVTAAGPSGEHHVMQAADLDGLVVSIALTREG